MRKTSRRTVLQAGLLAGGAGLLAACGRDNRPEAPAQAGVPSGFVAPDGNQVRAAEAARNPGTVREFRLAATAGEVDLGGLVVPTWSYGGAIPGEPIRVRAGEVVRAVLENQLPDETSIHWHGIALRNDADGVPGATQPPIRPGEEYVYEFTAPHPGTYFFHPHTGTQLDRGLYAPLIVEDPAEPLDYDQEWTVVLDDWLDGVTGTPEEVLAELSGGMGPGMGDHGGHGSHGDSDRDSGGHIMHAMSPLLGGDAGDVYYPHYLLNGRLASAPDTMDVRSGARLRLRLINAGGDTAFRVVLGGHRLTVTHTDGFQVEPVETDALLVGMGERYDVLVTVADGVHPLVALAEGKGDVALGLVRAGSGDAPGPDVRPAELGGEIIEYAQLRPVDGVRLAERSPDLTITLELTGDMMAYDWGFNGRRFDHANPTGEMAAVHAGERVRLDLVNTTRMWHPVHLHGHTFAVVGGPRKDTVNVLPDQTVPIEFDADNPGLWMVHCHNVYHAETGMMTMFGYRN